MWSGEMVTIVLSSSIIGLKLFILGQRLLNVVRYIRTIGYSIRQYNKMSDAATENTVAEAKALSSKRPLENEDVSSQPENLKKPRMKKKKVVMLMSYCGQGYYGMQINHGFKTIEGDLFLAFQKLGIMDEESFKYPQIIGFQRAARTDKGVSATRQVVSLKMCMLIFSFLKIYLPL